MQDNGPKPLQNKAQTPIIVHTLRVRGGVVEREWSPEPGFRSSSLCDREDHKLRFGEGFVWSVDSQCGKMLRSEPILVSHHSVLQGPLYAVP